MRGMFSDCSTTLSDPQLTTDEGRNMSSCTVEMSGAAFEKRDRKY